MAYIEDECSYIRADSVRRFNVGRVRVLNNPPAFMEYTWEAMVCFTSSSGLSTYTGGGGRSEQALH